MPVLGVIASSGSGSSPTPYHADAVHLDTTAELEIPALTAADTHSISFSMWINVTNISSGQNNSLVAFDYDNASIGPGIHDPVTTPSEALYIYAQNSDGSDWMQVNSSTAYVVGTWFHLAGNINSASPAMQMLLDGVNVVDSSSGSGNPFLMSISGLSTIIDVNAENGNAWQLDYADVLVWTDQVIDWSNPTNFAKVSSGGKPVNPSVAVGAFGNPALYASGNASTFGQPNLGTGGAFTLTGSLTNASSSPSD